MAAERSWTLIQSAIEFATNLGEEIARLNHFTGPPVDPFKVLAAEKRWIQPFAADFGDAFDGRLEYQRPKFLLFYNTKYDRYPHEGTHHPKVRFTVGHELGHYFLDEHREYLVRGGAAHRSFAEFTADPVVERQADGFAGGLLLPRFLLGPIVNRHPTPTLKTILALKKQFDVSLISMMVRWVQLSDFPCAVVACRNGAIQWGFVSEGFSRYGAYRVRRGNKVESRSAKTFWAEDPACASYREGAGSSIASRWLETDSPVAVDEIYITLPYIQTLLAFVTAPEANDEDGDRGDD